MVQANGDSQMSRKYSGKVSYFQNRTAPYERRVAQDSLC
jgi:hypothetical protein